MDSIPHYSRQSFKPEFLARSSYDRTPSPPIDGIEPLSPTPALEQRHITTETNGARKRKLQKLEFPLHATSNVPVRESATLTKSQSKYEFPTVLPGEDTRGLYKCQASPSALDVLSTVATSPTVGKDQFGFDHPTAPAGSSIPFSNPYTSTFDPAKRGSKRTRSEVIGYRHQPWTGNPGSRPTTSHTPMTLAPWCGSSGSPYHGLGIFGEEQSHQSSSSHGIRMGPPTERPLEQDAELLLSFARSANGHSDASFRNPEPSLMKPYERSIAVPSYPVPGQVADQVSAPRSDTDETCQALATDRTELDESNFKAKDEESLVRQLHGLKTPILLETSQQQKPREHRGWPKGKPRGPRVGGLDIKRRSKGTTKKGEATNADRTAPRNRRRKSKTAATQDEDEPTEDAFDVSNTKQKPRRKSDVDWYAIVHKKWQPLEAISRRSSAPPGLKINSPQDCGKGKVKNPKENEKPKFSEICFACKNTRNATNGTHELWINCNGCQMWFHTACAGFDNERKVKEVDKFYCKDCEADHGPTTFVRKSSRAHASVDYAGLHEGKLRTAVDVPEHHYIKPIKDGTIEFQQETFPRMRPELVTLDYFERCGGMTEPICIPAAWNPRPAKDIKPKISEPTPDQEASQGNDVIPVQNDGDFHKENAYDCVSDEGQDYLDMVIPQGLTVRQVAELYGPEEKVEVIDVKLQEGEDRRWNMRQWVDYYEADGEKPVRNVISLEVSQSKLGRLIKRPKIVRQLDLQDSVWPAEETAKGIYPKVQFYCLMSVADCYTDFHIDFGGSSVYYHILRGRKTFFFIPPKPKHLKKYEEWCLSPNQNSTFLGNETNECYRVDLFEGDTMLIPSGWIHAVWTPENSLVIGGNFLTRMHYGMQIQINDIEKNTGVARKFRYPYFQRILWLAVVQYLEQDPIPFSVVERLIQGEVFKRKVPVYLDFECESELSEDPEFFNAKFYSRGEIEGFPDLIRYIHRTVLVALGKVPGVQKNTQDAVLRSMPKGYGSYVSLAQTFALWAAWKRGNEHVPSWAHLETGAAELEVNSTDRKPTAAAQRRIARQAAHEAYKLAHERPNLRQTAKLEEQDSTHSPAPASPAPPQSPPMSNKATLVGSESSGELQPPKKPARFGVMPSPVQPEPISESCVVLVPPKSVPALPQTVQTPQDALALMVNGKDSMAYENMMKHTPIMNPTVFEPETSGTIQVQPTSPSLEKPQVNPISTPNDLTVNVPTPKRAKTRACSECKKSKRRCVHDENGQIDPIKAQEIPVARGSNAAKRQRIDTQNSGPNNLKRIKSDSSNAPSPLVNGAGGSLSQVPIHDNIKLASAGPNGGQNNIELSSSVQASAGLGSQSPLANGQPFPQSPGVNGLGIQIPSQALTGLTPSLEYHHETAPFVPPMAPMARMVSGNPRTPHLPFCDQNSTRSLDMPSPENADPNLHTTNLPPTDGHARGDLRASNEQCMISDVHGQSLSSTNQSTPQNPPDQSLASHIVEARSEPSLTPAAPFNDRKVKSEFSANDLNHSSVSALQDHVTSIHPQEPSAVFSHLQNPPESIQNGPRQSDTPTDLNRNATNSSPPLNNVPVQLQQQLTPSVPPKSSPPTPPRQATPPLLAQPQPISRSRSRTSSLHIQTTSSESVNGAASQSQSHSPPTSPLTELEPDSPTLAGPSASATGNAVNGHTKIKREVREGEDSENNAVRSMTRVKKGVEYYTGASAVKTPANSSESKSPVKGNGERSKKTPHRSRTGTRTSRTPSTPASGQKPNELAKLNGMTPVSAKKRSASPDFAVGVPTTEPGVKTPGEKARRTSESITPAEEMEEDKDVALARILTGEAFGLRRRGMA